MTALTWDSGLAFTDTDETLPMGADEQITPTVLTTGVQ